MKNNFWTLKIIIMAFIISFCFSLTTEIVMPRVNIIISVLLLIIFIFIGVLFDMIGVAVTTCSEKPFHSMSSKRIYYARTCIRLIKNSAVVSSFCNDVIGDICGIVSGSAGVIISLGISNLLGVNSLFVSLITTSVIASITIGGKAYGKSIALKNNVRIITIFSKVIYRFYK